MDCLVALTLLCASQVLVFSTANELRVAVEAATLPPVVKDDAGVFDPLPATFVAVLPRPLASPAACAGGFCSQPAAVPRTYQPIRRAAQPIKRIRGVLRWRK